MTKNVAIVFGGYSAEWVISEKSAEVVAEHLDPSLYRAFRVHISEAEWSVVPHEGPRLPIDRNDFSFELNGANVNFDVVFNAIHGTPGEDGVLAGYFDMLSIPYTSAGVLASAITFSKSFCNGLLRQFDELHIPGSAVILKNEPIDPERIIAKVGIPCFVKPNCAGSSFGISKVNNGSDLLPAIQHAFEHDDEVIIEQFIAGTEVSNGAFLKNGEVTVLPITEIVSENDFFDFNAKYEGASREITPARIDPEIADLIQGTTKKVYQHLRLKGMARIDYIIQGGRPFLIEVNTVPGLSEESILPQQVIHAGMTLQEFFGILIESADPQTT